MSRITHDVAQVQQAVSETVGDLLRESPRARGLRGAAVLLRPQAGARLLHERPSSSTRWCGSASACAGRTRRSQEEVEHLSHIAAEAFTGHRIVKAFGAEAHEAQRFQRRVGDPVPHEPEGHQHAGGLPPLMEFLGGIAVVGLIWYGSRRSAPAD
jgi:ATP-binding cassette, subfamily B, bacterial MsbA